MLSERFFTQVKDGCGEQPAREIPPIAAGCRCRQRTGFAPWESRTLPLVRWLLSI